jgi:vacuolar protein sorting-associated protein 11
LYQRNLYILAINIAQKAGVDTATQNVIFRKYGDHLYQKGDYDTAMQQYLRAIDNTEPSQILRKFLDTQRIHNLIEYLEELHDHEKATADHTTLLLNCYAKLKDTEKLDAFIRAPGELKFDLETAISMCRQGGYFEQAAYLAIKHGENSLVVDILIEDSKKYPEALAYIWQLEPLAAYSNMMKYARVLLEHCADETTQLFIEYYTGKYAPKEELKASEEPQPQSQASAFQNLSALLPLPYMNRSAVATPAPEGQQQATTADAMLASKTATPAPEYSVPKPRTAFSAFIPHPPEFIRFLEALTSQRDISSTDKTDLHTTLFEMYLETAKSDSTPASEKEVWQQRAKALIATQPEISAPSNQTSSSSSIPTSSVLLLSSLSNFPTGTTLVRERANLYPDIFRSHTSAQDTSGAISALRKYGPEDPTLYPLALSYFSSTPTILASPGVKDELQATLRKIDQENLMAPLQVVKVLSQGGAVTMGMVKSYLAENIARERKEIQNNRTLIESYRSETAGKKAEINALASKPAVFQARRCASCGGTLDLPTVHFLCKHSFHQRCLNSTGLEAESAGGDGGGGAAECPICKPQNDTIKALRRAQVESTEAHELFQSALERSQTRFGTVSEFFGSGVMNVSVNAAGVGSASAAEGL